MKFDVFICHASEDKEDFVRPLAEKLRQQHIEVWYDEFSLKVGDSLTQKIDEGLTMSNFGIVVLSKNFFNKPWAKRELKGLNIRELSEGRDLILPIWHRINLIDVLEYSPPLADKMALSSTLGINSLIRKLKDKIKPEVSPLIVAKENLMNLNVDTPPISSEWWLDMIEYKEFLKYPDLNSQKRWTFPLPFPDDDYGRKRGMNLALSALQSDWSFEGEELNISPITPPDQVHEFIRKWPGLLDCSKDNANILALYVPQLTIPGFDTDFENEFDELLFNNNSKSNIIFSYGSHDTIDNKDPLCGDIIAYRHPTFGNYTIEAISHWYFYAHNTSYLRSYYNIFEGFIWLLSSASDWLPRKYLETFIDGICKHDLWHRVNFNSDFYQNDFVTELHRKTRKEFAFTNSISKSLLNLISKTLSDLDIKDNSGNILQKIKQIGLVEQFYEKREYIESKRKNTA